MSSGCGIVNGWCVGIGRPSSSSRLEQREVDDPQEVQSAFGDRRTAEVEPQRAEHRPHHRPLARDEQQQVAGRRAERVDQTELLGLRQELRDRRLQHAAVAHAHPHEAGRAQRLGPIGQRVELRARHVALARRRGCP